jgi:hypothetical protein
MLDVDAKLPHFVRKLIFCKLTRKKEERFPSVICGRSQLTDITVGFSVVAFEKE